MNTQPCAAVTVSSADKQRHKASYSTTDSGEMASREASPAVSYGLGPPPLDLPPCTIDMPAQPTPAKKGENGEWIDVKDGTADSVHVAGVPRSYRELDNLQSKTAFQRDTLAIIRDLEIPGWTSQRIRPSHLHIQRVSGAYTNAVYFVSYAPSTPSLSPRSPPKLLLRIYGPSVSNLLSRATELAHLHKLSLLDIGPRLLGTFANGRVEEYLLSHPLNKYDLRNPRTSKWIAMRMRELHSIYPKPHAKYQVWKNIFNWIKQADRVSKRLRRLNRVTPVQRQALDEIDLPRLHGELHAYRQYMDTWEEKTGRKVVFAHNDTQYGNILRLDRPPLNQPAHHALVVIDFEYSGYNARGVDIANHFSEWMMDYHSADGLPPHEIRWQAYPSPKEKQRFVKAYLNHNPASEYKVYDNTAKQSRKMSGAIYADGTDSEDEIVDADSPEDPQLAILMEEVRRWTPAVHAMWGVWGIVQSDVHDEPKDDDSRPPTPEKDDLDEDSHMSALTEAKLRMSPLVRPVMGHRSSTLASVTSEISIGDAIMTPRRERQTSPMPDLPPSIQEHVEQVSFETPEQRLERLVQSGDPLEEHLEDVEGAGNVDDDSGNFDCMIYAREKIRGFRTTWSELRKQA